MAGIFRGKCEDRHRVMEGQVVAVKGLDQAMPQWADDFFLQAQRSVVL